MGSIIYALDTNIVSYWLKKDERVIRRLNEMFIQGNNIILPPITYYEIWRGFKHKTAPKMELAFALICEVYDVGEMSTAAWAKAADIYADTRRKGTPIEDTDILMAAFCIVNDYTLVTNNAKHFKDIDMLRFVNWTE